MMDILLDYGFEFPDGIILTSKAWQCVDLNLVQNTSHNNDSTEVEEEVR